MICQEQGRRPRHTGRLAAGLLAALLAAATLAGCGGGGGGGGGSSSGGGGGGGSVSETTVVAPQAVTASAMTVGNLAADGAQVNIPAGTSLVQASGQARPRATVTSYSIGIYTLPTSSAPMSPAGFSPVSPIFDVRSTAPNGQPDRGTFSQPVTVEIANTASLTPDQLALAKMYYYDTTLGSWQSLPTDTADAIPAGAIGASNTNLTFYALFAPNGLPGTP